jgi:hypothetical protein
MKAYDFQCRNSLSCGTGKTSLGALRSDEDGGCEQVVNSLEQVPPVSINSQSHGCIEMITVATLCLSVFHKWMFCKLVQAKELPAANFCRPSFAGTLLRMFNHFLTAARIGPTRLENVTV